MIAEREALKAEIVQLKYELACHIKERATLNEKLVWFERITKAIQDLVCPSEL
jgi:hypothetical protein